MRPKDVIFDSEAREKLIKGMNVVAKAVGKTLGPKGRNVAINEADRIPRIIHDGVGVARRIDLRDPFEDMGAQLLKQASIRTGDVAGDGTTTSTILAQFLINKGVELITSGKNPMTLKTELEEASKLVMAEIKKLSKKVKTSDIEKVASISSADPKIGKMVAEALKTTGENGFITVEEGKTAETLVEYKQGLEFDRGWSSPYFVNNDKEESVIEDAYILFTDIKINHHTQIVPFLEKVIKVTKNIVIVGEVLEEALATLIYNKFKTGLNILNVQAPAFGPRRIDELQDMAILTGGQVIMADSGRTIDTVVIEELGRAEKVVANRDTTKIQGGAGEEARIKTRISELQEQIKIANSEYDGGMKKQRLAKLIGGVAIIRIGGVTEIEIADKRERTIDAVHAAKASTEEGILAGGQITFLTLSQMNFWPDTTGARILREAIKKPFQVLMENTGYDYAESMVKIAPIKYPVAIDVMDGQVKDMIEAGVIDPTKVTRSALENAVSVAGMVYTTEVLISEPYEDIETK